MSPDDHAHDNSHGHPHAPIEDDPLGYYALMQEAVQELLTESGVLTADEIRRAVEAMDERSPAQGARVIARAWTDPAFRARLLADGTAACRELGIEIGPTRLIVVENTPDLHNLVVCTLCSCYPRMLLGLPPDWYKSRAYRSRPWANHATYSANSAPRSPPISRSASMIRRRTCVTSCCPGAPREPKRSMKQPSVGLFPGIQ